LFVCSFRRAAENWSLKLCTNFLGAAHKTLFPIERPETIKRLFILAWINNQSKAFDDGPGGGEQQETQKAQKRYQQGAFSRGRKGMNELFRDVRTKQFEALRRRKKGKS
jgi:hypothetical protein